MTTERWTDERLDRLALTVESSAANINELSQTQVRMMQELADYRRDMAEMRADFREMVITQTQVLQRIDETQAEVRGLQTENRRILDHLFGEQQN
jgi:septal ring factor EnvC (AmiA/AmiB activator)